MGRLDHCAPAANMRPFMAKQGRPVLQAGNIGGCPANIRDQSLFFIGKESSPCQAGRRAGQDGFHRPGAGIINMQERAIALYHHQRAVKAKMGHLCLGCPDQPVQQAD